MGQILNRIINLAKTYKSENYSKAIFNNSEDDELKKIIDELEEPEMENNYNNQHKNNQIMTHERAYKILNVMPNATIDQLKKAYIQRIKEYHPDRLQNFGDEIIELAKKKTQQINEAYSFLMNK